MNNGRYIPSGTALTAQNTTAQDAGSFPGTAFQVNPAKNEKKKANSPLEYLNLYNYLTANCTTDNVLDILDARLLIEPVIAHSAAIQRDDDDLKRIQDNLDKMAACSDREKFSSLDVEFHCLVAAATKNGVLPLVIHQIYSLINKVASKLPVGENDSKETVLLNHRNILDFIGKRDAASAAQAMKEHLLIAHSQTVEMMITELNK